MTDIRLQGFDSLAVHAGQDADPTTGAVIPPVHTASAYPRTLAQAAPARVVAGPDPGERARRAATVATEAFGDAIARQLYSLGTRGPGLRGGRFTVDEGAFRLRGVRFVEDVPVSGVGTYESGAASTQNPPSTTCSSTRPAAPATASPATCRRCRHEPGMAARTARAA